MLLSCFGRIGGVLVCWWSARRVALVADAAAGLAGFGAADRGAVGLLAVQAPAALPPRRGGPRRRGGGVGGSSAIVWS
jgi:hypothetical protein